MPFLFPIHSPLIIERRRGIRDVKRCCGKSASLSHKNGTKENYLVSQSRIHTK
jgi:hypothetical protein